MLRLSCYCDGCEVDCSQAERASRVSDSDETTTSTSSRHLEHCISSACLAGVLTTTFLDVLLNPA